MNSIGKFSNNVIQNIGSYVYRLIDPRNGETFYVGRGVGNRVFEHAKFADINKIIDIEDEDEKWKDEISLKIKRILEIQNAGLDVLHIIHRHGMDKDTAKEVEAALIDAYPGLSNILGNDYGPMHVCQLESKYAVEMMLLDESKKYLLININSSISEKDIYDATRYAWKLNVQRASKVDFILAESQGIVKSVFVKVEWYSANDAKFNGFPNHGLPEMANRYGFVGEQVFHSNYIGKRTPPRKKGALNPIRYMGLDGD
jgi:hypothetical protein